MTLHQSYANYIKHLLSQELVNDILTFCNDMHDTKIELLNQSLIHQFGSGSLVKVEKVVEHIKMSNNVTGLKTELSTNWKRNQYFKKNYKFVEPERIIIGHVDGKPRFYYYLPVRSTLSRLLEDNSLRKFIIRQPVFFNKKVNILP